MVKSAQIVAQLDSLDSIMVFGGVLGVAGALILAIILLAFGRTYRAGFVFAFLVMLSGVMLGLTVGAGSVEEATDGGVRLSLDLPYLDLLLPLVVIGAGMFLLQKAPEFLPFLILAYAGMVSVMLMIDLSRAPVWTLGFAVAFSFTLGVAGLWLLRRRRKPYYDD